MSQNPTLLLAGLLVVCPTFVAMLALVNSEGVLSEWMKARPRQTNAKAQAKKLLLEAQVDAQIRDRNTRFVTDLLGRGWAGPAHEISPLESILRRDDLRSFSAMIAACLAASERDCARCKGLPPPTRED